MATAARTPYSTSSWRAMALPTVIPTALLWKMIYSTTMPRRTQSVTCIAESGKKSETLARK